MRRRLPPFVQSFTDRHGRARFYFRKRGLPRVPLPGAPWSPEFMAAHSAALAGEPAEIGSSRTAPGTIDALAAAFLKSTEFARLAPATRNTYRGIIDRFRIEHGPKHVSTLRREHVERLIAAKAGTPSAAANLTKILRALLRFAVAHGWRRDDPTQGVRAPVIRTAGFRSWSEDDIAAFEARHAIGTRARLAFALLLFTAQRRGDIVRLGKQHIREGVLTLRQQKTNQLVELPVHPELRAILEASETGDLTLIVTSRGRPFTPASFGTWFAERVREAGLAGLSAHGLRKAAARRLAEAGASTHEIAAITGHQTLREVARYTAAADRKRLAREAMKKIKVRTKSVKPA